MAEQQQPVVMSEDSGSPRRRLRPGRIIILAIVFLLLGAIVNVAVAWGCAVWSPFTQMDREYSGTWPVQVPPEWRESRGSCDLETGFGVSLSSCHGRRYVEEVSYSVTVVVLFCGWPLKTLASTRLRDEYELMPEGIVRTSSYFPLVFDITESQSLSEGIVIPHGWKQEHFRCLPTQPRFPGLAINTIFYALLLWLPFGLFIYAKRRRRLRRGQCLQCGYPMGDSPRCTECGASLLERTQAAGG